MTKLKTFFSSHSVFRYEELLNFMEAHGVHQPQSVMQQLAYHCKTGNLTRVRKYLYIVNFTGEDHWVDPYLIAAKATPSAVISHHSALELHQLAYSSFEDFTFWSDNKSPTFEYQTNRFRAIPLPSKVAQKLTESQFVDVITRENIEVRVTSLERAIVDVLDRPYLAGGWEEVWRSLEHVISFDIEKLLSYTLLLENATLAAKVGYFLDQLPEHLKVDNQYLEQLKQHIPKRPHYMDKQMQEGRLVKQWNLIIPRFILERAWEEPHAGHF